MFCRQCGTKLDDDARFCSNCGTATAAAPAEKKKSYDTGLPIITAKPVFIPWVTVASVIPIQIFMTIWAGGFFGGFSMFGIEALGLGIPAWSPFVFFGALAFFGIPLLTYYARKRTYEKTEYKVYEDRLEYAEGFWTVENKTVKLKNVTEANLRRGVIQKNYGLGTIILSTPATGYQQGRARSGIRIADIQNPEHVYNKILELID
jgi:membrane protein YdbS with pleckstrin-like domain